MVYLSTKIIDQIKEARGEQEVRSIILSCIETLPKRLEDGRIEKKYTRDILMALKYHKAREFKPSALDNMAIAIEIVKNFHAAAAENVF